MTAKHHVGRVAWVSESARPDGGVGRYVLETAAHLRARGVRSTLYYDPSEALPDSVLDVFDGAYPLVDATGQLRAARPDIIYAHRLPRGVHVSDLVRTRRPVLRFFHDYDVFCLRQHKYTTIQHVACEKPVGPSCYACLGFVSRPGGKLRLRTVSSLLSEQRANMALDGFVVGSRAMAQEVISAGFDASRVHAIPLYASLPLDTDPVTRRSDLFLFVGALTRGKGVDVALRALASTRNRASLIVVGKGPQEAELISLCRDLGLADRVAFLGRLSQRSIARWYREATALVMPVRAPETFGLVGVEAMSHGAPVVASTVGGIGEWLEHEHTGLAIPPGSPIQLANAMNRLMGDAALRERLGSAAREGHRARFLPEHHVDRLRDLLDTMTTRHA